ncbi:diacylglycerol kinase eta isoform X1 [Drosophila sulfurigaster albostrigata]|uniref:diacylglycerol kinase eta isoform X1 n=2 Tax=Drosophila sulfurigaster albostrigata TaxID=89887 RepID=UPI002D21B135|nr:diacylglycerol kinase eta isoform X1 [Drosophila sulfurigaster albostrigata]
MAANLKPNTLHVDSLSPRNLTSLSSGLSSACSSGSVSPVPIIPIIAISRDGDETESESEIETEPARIFHRRMSTKRNSNLASIIKEGFLLKHTWSFQRWRRRYFRLKRNHLYYAKDAKCDVFDEIDLSELCYFECSIKNVNHSFQIITPTRSLVLCADSRREMEDWLGSLKMATAPQRPRGDSFLIDQHDILSNHHHWYATSHARPTYCNVCRDALSGVTSHGLSCEVCKCKVHKRCAAKAIANCKWTTLATVGKDIIEQPDGSIIMPHQWMEGNLPVSAVCAVCKKTCGSVLRLQDWRCLWCRDTVHVACRPQMAIACPIGPAKLSVVPPTSVHSISTDDAWDVVSPKGNFSPLLVFVNSKSGDNQGVKFLRRFKQLLNPAQVFDLISTGPSLGLRLFRHFEIFRILVCSGDGSVGWVLSEIDRFNMHKQCQVAVMPLGTGNDLARVLGWGSSCDDDTHLPQILERYESASTKMLDRWSIMVFEKAISVPKTPKMSITTEQEALLTGMVTSANHHLRFIVETNDTQTLISSTRTLCDTVEDLVARICEHHKDDEQLTIKCDILRQKLNMLLDALQEEEMGAHSGDDLIATIRSLIVRGAASSAAAARPSYLNPNMPIEKNEKDHINSKERRNSRSLRSSEKEALQSRANSVKRAIYNVVEHSEPGRPKRYQRKLSITPFEALKIPANNSGESTPCSSPLPIIPPINIISPTMETSRLTCISPLPDTRRDSVDENFFNSINLPAPRQFADSRRSSGVPEVIQEMEEGANGETIYRIGRLSLSGGANIDDAGNRLSPSSDGGDNTPTERKVDFLRVPIITGEPIVDPLSDYRPIEVFERTYYMARELDKDKERKADGDGSDASSIINCDKEDANENEKGETLQPQRALVHTCNLQVPGIVVTPNSQNVYTSASLTIIDTDAQTNTNTEQSSSEELGGEASDVLSAISNEECSVASEIFDKPETGHTLGDIIQNLDASNFTHIDSPETSDETEAMPGESLMDDISSVLGHDITNALADNTITDDTTTLCSEHIGPPKPPRKKSMSALTQSKSHPLRRNSSPPRIARLARMDSDDNPQQFGFENIVFEIDNRCDDQKMREPPRFCSLAQFVEGNDIARQSFKRPKKRISLKKLKSTTTIVSQQQLTLDSNRNNDSTNNEDVVTPTNSIISKAYPNMTMTTTSDELDELSMQTAIKIEIQDAEASSTTTATSTKPLESAMASSTSPTKKSGHGQDVKRITFDESCKKESFDDVNPNYPQISVVVRPPTPLRGDSVKPTTSSSSILTTPSGLLGVRSLNSSEIRRHSSHAPSLSVREYDKDKDRRHSGFNPNFLTLDPEHARFLSSSPAASRRISCGSLFKPNEALPNLQTLKGSKSSLFMGSTLFGFEHFNAGDKEEKLSKDKEKTPTEETSRKLPIINPLVRLPNWPNLTNGTGFISKCLLANADTLCAAVSPLMDPDETLLAGYHEKCVMNNYFGIGIDAKISLDFHNKREEHPEKCRSRARNYMWYGVLGSKQLLQKTCKNLEQRVQLECDGQRIPLPELQGIVILNIPSFMGGTNFWGSSTKKDDIFLTPSFDDRVLEVVAVFGSVQMAASRLINLQHHRIAQCQSVQINILGDEEIPIQVDGEAWLQPPGMIRILHKNRVQMLCRNRSLEVSLKSWQEKQRQHSISIQRDASSTASEHAASTDEVISERECYVLLNFIEAVSSLVKWVKFLIISHPALQHDLYEVACRASEALESIHPQGKLLEGPSLRTKLVEVIDSSRQLYDDACTLLRDRGHSLILREDLETKLSAALANMEMELKKCSVQKCIDGKLRAYFNVLAPNEESDGRRKSRAFWGRLRSGSTAGQQQFKPPLTNTREAANNWSVNEVVTWLETMQLSEYVDSFLKNDIRGKELLTLGRRDLKDLGVVKVGHVKRILQAIKDLSEN